MILPLASQVEIYSAEYLQPAQQAFYKHEV